MYCGNCGKELSDSALFCNNCGTRVEKTEENQFVQKVDEDKAEDSVIDNAAENAAPESEETVAVVTEEAPALEGLEAASEAVEFAEEASEDKPKKKVSKGLVAGIVAGAIAVLGVVGFAAWKPISYAMFPEYYVGNLIGNTFENISDDVTAIQENVLGFSYDSNDKLTSAAVVEVNEDYEDGAKVKAEAKFSNNPDDNEFAGVVKAEASKDGEMLSADGQLFWNDENIGLGFDISEFPAELRAEIEKIKVLGKDFVVPSKNFGKALAGSEIGEKLLEEIGEEIDFKELDLSYSNITGMTDELKPLMKEWKKDFVEFLEDCDMGDRKSINFDMGDDEVGAKKISVEIKLDDVVDLIFNMGDSLTKDKYINELLGKDTVKRIDDLMDEAKDDMGEIPDEEFEIELIEYKGRIVGVEFEVDGVKVSVGIADKKHSLNGLEIKVKEGNSTVTAEYSANWASEDEEIFAEVKVNAGGEKLSAKLDMNYNKGKFEATAKGPDGEEFSIGGKCSKKDKFSITLDDIKIPNSGSRYEHTIEFDEWFENNYKYSYESEDAYGNYIRNKDNGDYLFDLYMDDYDYYDFMEWYGDKGSQVDANFISYDDWLKNEAYNSAEVKEQYDYEDGEYVDFEYDTVIKITVTLSKDAEVKPEKREQINLFETSEDEFRELFGEIPAEETDVDNYEDLYDYEY